MFPCAERRKTEEHPRHRDQGSHWKALLATSVSVVTGARAPKKSGQIQLPSLVEGPHAPLQPRSKHTLYPRARDCDGRGRKKKR
ncbi:hypothetical protein LZ32DRAFT_433846 [Colletotrichum eremochloae]|nr:hypothetical protein LZ32DRAFT_433846 [Colletotrichum eremochloae]